MCAYTCTCGCHAITQNIAIIQLLYHVNALVNKRLSNIIKLAPETRINKNLFISVSVLNQSVCVKSKALSPDPMRLMLSCTSSFLISGFFRTSNKYSHKVIMKVDISNSNEVSNTDLFITTTLYTWVLSREKNSLYASLLLKRLLL